MGDIFMPFDVHVVGTFDTKKHELLLVKRIIERQGLKVITIDVSAKLAHASNTVSPADIAPEAVAAYCPHNQPLETIFDHDRGVAIQHIIACLQGYVQKNAIKAIIGIGGSGGTALIAPAMRLLPVGYPKLLVSTVASGNTQPYVGASDITMMYSVADIAGLNTITHKVLSNAAYAIAGMAKSGSPNTYNSKPAIGLSMFGVTTPCVTAVTEQLKSQFDTLVFHATGAGGQAMEALAEQKQFSAVIDITTTEIADLLNGGVFSAGEKRLDAIATSGIPYIGSVGALDMINFGAPNTVPNKFKHRQLYYHNPQVTLVRTNVEESMAIGKWIAAKLNKCNGPVRFIIPTQGVSLLSTKNQPFYDPEADEALFTALKADIITTHQRQLILLPYAINDSAFSQIIVDHFFEMMND